LPEAVQEHYGKASSPEIIIMPSFNELCGGLPLNDLKKEDVHGSLLTMADWEQARLYLLDGTDLGRLLEIKAAQKRTV
jgi:metallophosphoesterase superfamily enzyme